MKEETGNDKFVYEISCDQMCGKGHTGMRGTIVVETQEEFDAWMAGKKPQYVTVMDAAKPAVAKDTTAVKPVAAVLNK